MENKQLLNQILTGENVVEKFYFTYKNNAEFRAWLDDVLPEVEMCENQKQNNPWHIYNVLGHLLHSVQSINTLTTKLDKNTQKNLAYAMFLHDIGKPACHLKRIKNDVEIDSFFNHEKDSFSVANRVLKELGFDKQNADIVATLVLKHHIFINLTTDKEVHPNRKLLTKQVVLDEIKKLDKFGNGFELLKQLVYVGKADAMAQNPEMTASEFKLLDDFDNILKEIEKE